MDDDMCDIEQELHQAASDKTKQLDLLKREVGHIIVHNVTPSEGWFDERIKIIQKYYEMDWMSVARRYHNKDDFIHNTSLTIARLLDDLIDECTAQPNFHIRTYSRVLNEIQNVMMYYKNAYKCNQDDDSISGLLQNMNLSRRT